MHVSMNAVYFLGVYICLVAYDCYSIVMRSLCILQLIFGAVAFHFLHYQFLFNSTVLELTCSDNADLLTSTKCRMALPALEGPPWRQFKLLDELKKPSS